MKKTMIKIVSLIALAGTLLADGPALTEETRALLQEAKAQTQSVTPEKLSSLLAEGNIVLLDVRDPDEWDKNAISYARSVKISRGFLEIKYPKLILDKYTKEDTFIVYCAMEPRSVFAAQRLQQLGFKHVFYLQGGLNKYNSLQQ